MSVGRVPKGVDWMPTSIRMISRFAVTIIFSCPGHGCYSSLKLRSSDLINLSRAPMGVRSIFFREPMGARHFDSQSTFSPMVACVLSKSGAWT